MIQCRRRSKTGTKDFITRTHGRVSMVSFPVQVALSFVLSSAVVVAITVIAERFGTKVGGILGTLPSTIVVAFVFIYLGKGADFASDSVAVVPAVIGINMVFLLVLALLIERSLPVAFATSFVVWTALSALLYLSGLDDVLISIAIYVVLVLLSLLIMERYRRIGSLGKVKIHYTPGKLAARGILAGVIIAIAVMLSNIGTVVSGIFSVFPVILASAMFITAREHGPRFARGMAKSMTFGTPSVVSYAAAIHFLYPVLGLIWGTLAAYGIAATVTAGLFFLRDRIT